MKKALTACLLVLFCCTQVNGQFNPCSWKYRKRITFDPTKVSGSSDLTDFPVLITFASDANLETVANGGHVENANGYDIVFTAEDGITQLDHDLDGYSATTGSLTVWVKIPVLSTSINTYIYMYYGNSSIGSDQSSTSTWSNGFVGVWHFDNSLNNSTGTSGMNGTNNGSTNTSTSKFNQARSFNGSSNYIDVTPYNSAYDLTSEITISGWIRLAGTGSDQKILGNQNNVNGGYKFGVFSDNKIEFEIRNSGNTPFLSRSASGGSALTTNTWYYVVGMYSDAGNAIRTYLNGSLDRNYATTASCGTSSGTLKFGREPFQNGAYFDGQMDEIRLSNVARSADWVATEYENQSSPSTFYSISSEPKIWDGSSSTSWNTGSNWSGNTTPSVGQDVIIPNVARDPVLNSSPNIGAMWIQSGAQFGGGTSTRTITITFDILNCGTLNGSTGHVKLGTNTIQTQHLSGTGTFDFYNLIIDNQFVIDPSTKLNAPINVDGTLTLTSGIVGTTSTNILAITSTGASSSGSSQSFVSGPMSKQGNTDFVFPVGKGQEWRRISVSNISASTTFRAEYFTSAYTNTSPVTSPLNNVSKIEYWQLDRTAGTGNANVGLYWENVAYSVINDCNDITVARWNGASWVEQAATAVAGSGCSGSGTGTVVTNAVVTNFSPFTFGSKSPFVNALPLELISFSGRCEMQGPLLQWSTTNERNTSHFEVEKSIDGVNYQKAGQVKAQGHRRPRTDYEFADRGEGLWYYRLKMVDTDGAYSYSRISAVQCGPESSVTVYPNPGAGEFFVKGLVAGRMLTVLNSAGQVVLLAEAEGSQARIVLEDKGFYILQISGETAAHKLIVR